MEQILKQFITGNLFNASRTLLEALHIKHTQEEPSPMRYADYLEVAVPQYIQNALQLVHECYYIGEVCDDSISGSSTTDTTLAEDIEKLRANVHYQSMMIFAVDFNSDSHVTRSDMAVLTRAFNRLVYNFPVTVIFRQGDYLSIATCERTEFKQEWRQGQGEKLGKVALLRNVNCSNPHRGHLDILKGLECGDCTTFDKLYERWMKVFNSEILTKKFYDELFEWYQWAVNPETKVSFPGDVNTQDDDREDIDTRVIRLITRLMFVWFIKQKGLVPDNIFNQDYVGTILKNFDPQSETDSNYYQAILQNLFFGTLNRPIIEDGEVRGFAKASRSDVKNLYRYEDLFTISEQQIIDIFASVPFLNCGLFECQDKCKTLDGVQRRFYNDGFSRNAAKWADGTYKYRAVVPNILFFKPEKGLLSIFDKYVFTIEENTPQDVQVALDPELLGKVFENLLGAYNPETKETARNQSGSFYTPREIVQYMVNESLVAHLKRTVGEDLETQYRQLLDFTTEDVELTTKQKCDILHSLFTCKVLDPACGSGAFPMGMLQQMVHILQQVDPTNAQWKDVLLNMAVDESRRAFGIVDEEERRKKLLDIEETFNNGLNSPDYTRKLYIIESCIYGVDIQPIAMLITRLRFFITLICEQKDIKRDKPEENFGIKTLPNLESKFVAANSLIDADIHKYNEDWTNDEILSILKNELIAIRRRHFYTRKRGEKIRLLKEDEQKRQQIHSHINRLVGEPNEAKIAELTQRIADHEQLMERYQGEDWIDETVQHDLFSAPQTIRVDRNKREREHIKNVIEACKRDIEHEQHKCTPQGFEAAVLQVTDWNPYDQNSVSPFLDIEWMFGVTDGFDIVIANPPYIRRTKLPAKDKQKYEIEYQSAQGQYDIYLLFIERGLSLLKEGGAQCYINPIRFFNSDYGEMCRKFILRNSMIKKILNVSQLPVFEDAMTYPCIMLYEKGVKDNNILEYYRPTYLEEIKELKVDTYRLLQQIDIIRHNEKIFAIPLNHNQITIIDKIESSCEYVKQYFDVARGLPNNKVNFDGDSFKAIKSRFVRRYKITNEISVSTSYAERFKKEMLIMPRTVKYLQTSYKPSDLVVLDRIYYLTELRNVNIKFVLACLNSCVSNYWFEFYYDTLKVSGGYFDLNGDQIKSIPLPHANKETINRVNELVDSVLAAYKKDLSIEYVKEEDEIDIILSHLYGLNYSELKMIKPSIELTDEGYNKYTI